MTLTNDIPPAYNNAIPVPPVRYAGFWIRLVSSVIDAVILGLINFAVNAVLPVDHPPALSSPMTSEQLTGLLHSSGQTFLIDTVITVAIIGALLSSSWQATFGMRMVGIYMATRSGKRVSIVTAILRYFCAYVSGIIFGIGYLMVAWTREKTALHDLMTNTRVLYGKMGRNT